MNYFINSAERKASHSTQYHEFFPGEWDGESHWNRNSVYLHDDIFPRGLARAIESVVEDYNYYGPTKITENEWLNIGSAVKSEDEVSQAIYNEATEFLTEVFKNNDRFYILGI